MSAGRRATLPRHIILTLGRPVCALTPKCCVLSGEAAYTNFNVFGSTRPGIEPTTFHTRGKHANHYTAKAVCCVSIICYYFIKITIIGNGSWYINFLILV